MKFKCLVESCGRKFLYAATKTITATITAKPDFTTNAVPYSNDSEFESTEYRCCPYCGSMDFDEITEKESVIVSVKSVNLEEVDDWLAKGYTIQSLYAKNAVLTKKESPETVDCGTTQLEEVTQE